MTEITISSGKELAEVVAERLTDGVMLSIFIEERGEVDGRDEAGEDDE